MKDIIPTKEDIMNALNIRHTKKIQDKLNNAHVAVCGLGGLGSAISISLSRAGIGHLHLIDFDKVDLTNLNRQQYSIDELNMPKPEAMKQEILRFSPYADIKTNFIKLTQKNIPNLISNDDYICEAFDNPEQKAILTNTILEYFPNKYLVGASGMAGYGNSNEIITRQVFTHYFLCGDGHSEITQQCGLMAPRVMICAAHQANKIIELIVNSND